MQAARVALGMTAGVSAAFGVVCLLWPDIVRKVGLQPVSRSGRAEVRAMYGGMELGLGAFFAYAAVRPELHRVALLAQVCGIGGLALGRLAGIVQDRPGMLIKLIFAAEAATAAVGAVALARTGARRE